MSVYRVVRDFVINKVCKYVRECWSALASHSTSASAEAKGPQGALSKDDINAHPLCHAGLYLTINQFAKLMVYMIVQVYELSLFHNKICVSLES